MKLIIEVNGGCVTGVYCSEPHREITYCVVDLDNAEVDEPIEPGNLVVEPFNQADPETLKMAGEKA